MKDHFIGSINRDTLVDYEEVDEEKVSDGPEWFSINPVKYKSNVNSINFYNEN